MSNNPGFIKEKVREKYGALAEQHTRRAAAPIDLVDERPQVAGCCDSTSCCGGSADVENLAEALYEQKDLAGLPDTVTMASLGCGNPTAIASLKPGETILDLGSGGGIDCFLAARAVGPTGQVIGVDMTDRMLELANTNKAKLGLANVEFRKGEIEDLPVDSGSVDVIISNCVINLSPDKEAVFREAFRVLKPGGRLAVSDIVTQGEMPEVLRANISGWTGCITGAIDQDEYMEKMRRAGFTGVAVESRASYGLEALDLLDEASRATLSQGVEWDTISDEVRVFSARIAAYKPASG